MKALKNLWANKMSKKTKAFISTLAVGILSVGAVASTTYSATGIVNTINSLMETVKDGLKAVYAGFLGIVTVLAVVLVGWCFLVKMFSKNPRSVDEANQWMKRIAIAWLCFMLISVFIAIGGDIVNNSGANTTTPWS